MPFARPPLPTLIGRAAADIQTRVVGSDPALRRSNTGGMARVLGEGQNGIYGYLDWQSKQILPTSSDDDILLQQASIKNVTQKPATAATGPITITGSDDSDAIEAGTILQRSDGAQFATVADVSISGGTATATVNAVVAGLAGNTDAGVQLTFATPISGVQNVAVVAGDGIEDGNDAEAITSVRARLITRNQTPPKAGALSDYVQWATAVPGVTRAWSYRNWLGVGTVGITFVMDGRDNIIPLDADVAAVQAAIDAVRPVTAAATVFKPTPVVQNYSLHLNAADTADIRAAVVAALADLWARESIPGGTLYDATAAAVITGGLIYLSHINQAISNATGEEDHVLATPNANIVMAAGSISILGDPTWT